MKRDSESATPARTLDALLPCGAFMSGSQTDVSKIHTTATLTLLWDFADSLFTGKIVREDGRNRIVATIAGSALQYARFRTVGGREYYLRLSGPPCGRLVTWWLEQW